MFQIDARIPLLVVVLAACAPSAATPTATDAVRTEVAKTWGQFTAAWVAGNVPAATAAFFTTDAIFSVPGANEAGGRAAIESAFNAFRAVSKVLAAADTTQEVYVAGDIAFEKGFFTLTEQTGNAAPITREGRYLALWKHQSDGTWKCFRFLFNWAPAEK